MSDMELAESDAVRGMTEDESNKGEKTLIKMIQTKRWWRVGYLQPRQTDLNKFRFV